jgi:hypothetical protein
MRVQTPAAARTQGTTAAGAVTVDSLMKAGGKRYGSTPEGRQDAYTSVIASKGKLYSVLTGFGRPASLSPLKKGSEKETLSRVVDNASHDKRLVKSAPLTPEQIKNCKRVDVSVPGRADQSRSLFIDKKTNEMYLHTGAVGWGPSQWSKIAPSN